MTRHRLALLIGSALVAGCVAGSSRASDSPWTIGPTRPASVLPAATATLVAPAETPCVLASFEPSPTWWAGDPSAPDLTIRLGDQVLVAHPAESERGDRENVFGWFEGGSPFLDSALGEAPLIVGRPQTEGEGSTNNFDYDLATLEIPPGYRLTWHAVSVGPMCGTGDEVTRLTEGGWSFQDQPNILHDALHGVSEAFVPGVRDYVIWIFVEVDPVGPRTEETAHDLYVVRYQLPTAPVAP